jgi:ATP-dependent Clp protease ATP-binding subunit ClpC
MKPRHSDSLLLVWRIAELEARHLKAAFLEPAHFLLGICKAVDLDLPAVFAKGTPDRDRMLEEALLEFRRIREVFREAAFDACRFRRQFRAALVQGSSLIATTGTLHRTDAAKDCFDTAEEFAQVQGGAVYPVHLLYATLLAEDEHREATLSKLQIDKKRLLTVAKGAVLIPQVGFASASRKERSRWN